MNKNNFKIITTTTIKQEIPAATVTVTPIDVSFSASVLKAFIVEVEVNYNNNYNNKKINKYIIQFR